MSRGNTPIGFGIYDLLTRVTPGAVFLLILGGSIAGETAFSPSQYTSMHLVAFAVLSLVFGEAINHIAGILFLPPTSFTRFLSEQGVDVERGRLDKIRSLIPYVSEGKSYVYTIAGDEFWPLFTTHFRLEKEYSNEWDIYNLLLAYLEPKLSPRTRRQQTVYHFVNNTIFAIVTAVLLVIGRLILGLNSGALSTNSIVWSVLITFLAVLGVYGLTMLFGFQESDFVSNLIMEYYIDRAESGDVDELDSESIQSTLEGHASVKESTD